MLSPDIKYFTRNPKFVLSIIYRVRRKTAIYASYNVNSVSALLIISLL